MHRESIFMHRGRASSRVNLCSVRRFHASHKLCTARRFHVSQKLYIPRRYSYLVGRFHTLQEIMHRQKISYPARNHTSRENIHAPKERMHYHKRNRASQDKYLPLNINCILYFDKSKHQKEHRRRHQEKYQHYINFYLFQHEMKITLKIDIAKQRTQVLFVLRQTDQVDIKCEGEQLSVNKVKDIISHLNDNFILISFISTFVESI